MIRHLIPKSIRAVTLTLGLAMSLTSTSSAGSSDLSAAKEWSTQNSPISFELRAGVRLTLSPGSKVIRQPTVPVPTHQKDLAPRAYVLELVTGRLDVEIDPKSKPVYSVMIRAPKRVAAFSTGGKSTIQVSPKGVVLAAVSGSELSASANDKWRILHPGTALAISRALPGGATHDLLKTPRLEVENPLKLSLGGTQATTLRWNAIPNARSYRISLSRKTPGGSELFENYEVAETSFVLPNLDPGAYSATVRAIDEWQLGSSPSNEVAIRIVGVAIPEGAYLINGMPQLGKYQQVSLSHVGGLEMAYGSGTTFGAVPHALGIPTGYPLLVRFRERGAKEEVTLSLQPRKIQSSIEFEPRSARWPGQAVKVVVRLSGPNDTELPESLDVSLNATVNARPIETRWAHEGRIWQTRIEQPPLAGPWVLRVTITDQGGQVLAHDFLEIAEARMVPGDDQRHRYARQ